MPGGIILIVEDDVAYARALARLVEAGGWRAEIVPTAEAFLEEAESHARRATCAVLDLRLPLMQGTDLYRALRNRNIEIPVVFLSANPEELLAGAELEGVHFLEKPVAAADLFVAIRAAVARRA